MPNFARVETLPLALAIALGRERAQAQELVAR